MAAAVAAALASARTGSNQDSAAFAGATISPCLVWGIFEQERLAPGTAEDAFEIFAFTREQRWNCRSQPTWIYLAP